MNANKPSKDVINHATAPDHFEHIFLVTGPAGCGKTTVAQHLAEQIKAPYVEGDDFHPPANKEKMGAGIPLTDADRWDWLIALKDEGIKQLRTSNACIITCSALKKKYRDVIRIANYEHPTVQIHFVFLKLDEETLQKRVASRVGHYMKEEMVHSQMVALEQPNEDDETDVMMIDAGKDKEHVQHEANERVQAKMKEYDALKDQQQSNGTRP
ncbi:hypothetical protein LTR70_005963 [Exophiala xenobiotica]|uniref:Gluconokinase n=1 Tax=Lithohypha guttulata TaxID=1690604 RepID=A0ABR0K6T0_9EURO|nr:hypothetical protein LTR24_006175 [Lithohypha guttulata]KAK5317223.1 hypothetical protein LTR70_005963 [Exophiala xenobiotica]